MNSNLSYSPETPNLGQIRRFLEPCDLEIWRITLKNNRAPLLSNIKLYVSFHHHIRIQTGVTVRKLLSWVVTSVALTFDLGLLHGPYPGPWWQLLKISWWYDDGNIVKKVWQTDRRTENTMHRAPWSQLKTGNIGNMSAILSGVSDLSHYNFVNFVLLQRLFGPRPLA